MLDFATAHGAQTRFIEYMPLGLGQRWDTSYVSRAEILDRIRPRLAAALQIRQPVANLLERWALGEAAPTVPPEEDWSRAPLTPTAAELLPLPAPWRISATNRLRGLKRLLPLPCAKATIPVA
jgi:hypothetical protein